MPSHDSNSNNSEQSMSYFKGAILNSVNRSLSSIFVNKSLFCSTKPAVNPLVITGASGAGKGTLMGMLQTRNPQLFQLSVSYTTRQPRQGEQHGREYFFVNIDDFKNEIGKDSFAEHCLVHGNYYGTLTKQVQSIMNEGKICLLDIDVQGAEKIHNKFPGWNYLFINFPSKAILEQRLRNRGTETEKQIQTRLSNSDLEMAAKDRLGFFHEVLNDTKEQAYNDVLKYLKNKYSHLHFE